MQAKHTPGPWKPYNLHNGRILKAWFIHSECADQPCGICRLDESLTGDQQVANAALIAAAPDLLEHCRTMLSWWEKNPDVLKRFPTLAIDAIRAAIRKAEGGAA